jgi:hypothetical protein
MRPERHAARRMCVRRACERCRRDARDARGGSAAGLVKRPTDGFSEKLGGALHITRTMNDR